MSTCERAALVEGILDGRLGPTERTSMDRHLSSCASCAQLLRELTSLKQQLRAAARPITPLEHQRARLALLSKAARPVGARRRPIVLLIAAVLALPLAAWAATSVLLPRAEPTRAPRVAAPAPKLAPPAREQEAVRPAPVVEVPAVAPPKPPRARRPVVLPSQASHDFAAAMDALTRGDFAASSELLAGFSVHYPNDARVEDALYLQAIALERAGRRDEARALAERYLAVYPSGAHRTQAQQLAAH